MKNKFSPLVLFALFCMPLISEASYRVVGYFADWGGNATNMMNNINYDALTHVNYAFGLPNTNNGNLYIAKPSLLKGLVTKAHAAGVKVNISVGGAGVSNDFSTICASNSIRNAMVDSIGNFVKKYNLDGVDLDWEFPSAGEVASLENLLMELRIKLDGMEQSYGRHIELTVATNGTDYYGKTLSSDATSYLDYINIMTYDDAAPHHSTFTYANTGLEYWSVFRGLPASMLVIGVPFYSKYSGSYSGAYSSFSASNPAGAYNDADGYFVSGGYTHDYNSKPILVQKAALVKNEYHSGGMMIWELTQDRTDQYSLLDVIGAEMGTYVGLKEINKELNSVESYPNPFTSETFVNIQKLNIVDESVQIEITDLSGNVVLSQMHPSSQSFVFQSNVSAGMYLCKISSSSTLYNVKLIKE